MRARGIEPASSRAVSGQLAVRAGVAYGTTTLARSLLSTLRPHARKRLGRSVRVQYRFRRHVRARGPQEVIKDPNKLNELLRRSQKLIQENY
jgi:hypothetical protein